MAAKGWRRAFDDPIPLPRGRQLVTLKDAGAHAQQFLHRPQRVFINLELIVHGQTSKTERAVGNSRTIATGRSKSECAI